MFRVVIVTQDDPFYVPVFFNRFLAERQAQGAGIEISGVVTQRPLNTKSTINLARQMISFYRLGGYLMQSARYAWVKLRQVLFTLRITKTVSTIRTILVKHKVPIIQCQNVNSKEFIDYITENKIDLIVSVAAAQIFGDEVLSAPSCGCINLHNAPLPHYRGMLPNFWQMMNDEKYSVLTVHTMTSELDRGLIVKQVKTEILSDMSLDDLIRVTKQKSADVLWEVLQDYASGQVKLTPMPDVKGSYYSFPQRKDVKRFRRQGKRIL